MCILIAVQLGVTARPSRTFTQLLIGILRFQSKTLRRLDWSRLETLLVEPTP